MLDRIVLKEKAKERLRSNHWGAVLVLWVGSLLGGYVMSVNNESSFSSLISELVKRFPTDNLTEEQFALFVTLAQGIALAILVYVAFALVFGLFVGNVVTVGMNGWLLRQWRGQGARVPFSVLFSSFQNYKKNVWVMAVYMVRVLLWMLLFLIPGIIKSYAYCMVPFILNDNPGVSAKEALRISNRMTYGYKGDLFWLDLSFIGWNWLSSLTGGLVGILYANPYIGMTWTGAYEQLKENAIQSGALTPADFGQLPPPIESEL